MSKGELSPCSCQPDHRQSLCLQLGAEERTSLAYFSRLSRQLLHFPWRSAAADEAAVVLMMQLAVMWCRPEGSMPLFPLIFFTSWHLPVFAQSLLNNGRKWKTCVRAQTPGRFSAFERHYCRAFFLFCFFYFSQNKNDHLKLSLSQSGKFKGGGSLIAILISAPFTQLLCCRWTKVIH